MNGQRCSALRLSWLCPHVKLPTYRVGLLGHLQALKMEIQVCP